MSGSIDYNALYAFLLKNHGRVEALTIVLSIESALHIREEAERNMMPLDIRFVLAMQQLNIPKAA